MQTSRCAQSFAIICCTLAVLPVATMAAPLNTLTATKHRFMPALSSEQNANSVTSNPTTAEPPVRRPSTRPCTVNIASQEPFENYNIHDFSFTPPAACRGPWSKVVLNADFHVAGRQFDRTVTMWVAGVDIYRGTTAEPTKSGVHWHVEKDVTEYSSIFKDPRIIAIGLGNTVNSTYTGIIYGTFCLQFYPANKENPVPRVPDAVYPLASNTVGGYGDFTLVGPGDTAHATFNLPRNIERVFLDVYTQSQIGDEFWYTCVPNTLANQLFTCGGTSFREGEVSVDGRMAGVAPVFPWIYTGGIDPYLWRPIPGVEAFNFHPYRVNLTPFAAPLSDGKPHTIAVSVYNANNYFLADGVLLLYLDHGTARVNGALVNDYITLPTPVVTSNIKLDPKGHARGPVDVSMQRKIEVSGYVNTSHGSFETRIHQTIQSFSDQRFNVFTGSPLVDRQKTSQEQAIDSQTVTIPYRKPAQTTVVHEQQFWPLGIDLALTQNPNQSYTQTTTVLQGRLAAVQRREPPGHPPFSLYLSNVVRSADTLEFDSSFNVTGHHGQHSSQRYILRTSTDPCYDHTIKSENGVLTASSFGKC